MLFLIAFVGAAVIALVLWRAMNTAAAGDGPPQQNRPEPPPRMRVSGPDDDVEFLRQLDERVKRRDDPPAG
jgi:hypothetical protein